MNKLNLKKKTQEQLLALIKTREEKIELLSQKGLDKSKDRGASAGSMMKTLNSIKHSKDLLKEEIDIIKNFIN